MPADDEISDLFKNIFGIDIAVNDLYKAEVVKNVYLQFMKDFGFSLDQLNQMPVNAPDSMVQYQEVYKDTIPTIILAKVIKHMINTIANDNSFQPADLFTPNKKRTKKFYEYLLSFYCQANNKVEYLQQIEEEADQKVIRKSVLQSAIEKNKRGITHLKMTQAEGIICANKVLEEINETKNHMEMMQARKNDIRGNLDKMKEMMLTVTTQLREIELQEVQGKEKIDNLQSKVIGEKGNEEIEEYNRQLENCQDDIADKKERLQNIQKLLVNFSTIEEIVTTQILVVTKDIKQEKERNCEFVTQMKNFEHKSQLCKEQAEDLSLEICKLEEKLTSLQEITSQKHLSWSFKKQSIIQDTNQLKLNIEENQRVNQEYDLAHAEFDEEKSNYVRAISEIVKDRDTFDITIASFYKKIIEIVDVGYEEMLVAGEKFVQNIDDKIQQSAESTRKFEDVLKGRKK